MDARKQSLYRKRASFMEDILNRVSKTNKLKMSMTNDRTCIVLGFLHVIQRGRQLYFAFIHVSSEVLNPDLEPGIYSFFDFSTLLVGTGQSTVH